MKRKDFLKNGLLGATGLAVGSSIFKNVKPKNSTYDKMMEQVGFNHLPPQVSQYKNHSDMKSVLHKASTRGKADHGWLQSYHSFSFANYYNPERMNFGVLRVLNDDTVAAAKGFGKHPHDNMEIISIPLEGDLEHQDSMGNVAVIKEGDVQVMSAGTGIFHSEYNKNKDQKVKFLQIWVFPNKKNVEPRYDQITLDTTKIKNRFQQILSPSANDEGVWIHQNAWFHLGDFEKPLDTSYKIKSSKNGVYAFVLDGEVSINGQSLTARDGFGVWDTDSIDVRIPSKAKILLLDVPMQLN